MRGWRLRCHLMPRPCRERQPNRHILDGDQDVHGDVDRQGRESVDYLSDLHRRFWIRWANTNHDHHHIERITFTATVTASGGGTPTGTISFKDGGKVIGSVTVNGGQAVFVTSALKKGSQKITAVYSGHTQFATSTSPTLTEVVQ